jgi:hypothetical protein
MKKIKYIIISVFIVCLLFGLGACKKEDQGKDDAGNKIVTPPEPDNNTKYQVTFVSGYSDVEIAPQETTGNVSEPSCSLTAFGYYTDKAMTKAFDFSSSITSNVTIYLKALKGDGTENSPYQISSNQSLYVLTHMGSDVTNYAVLTDNIKVESFNNDLYKQTSFSGTFDGNNKTITLDNESINDTGLFYKLNSTGVIKNLKVVGHIDASLGSCGVVCNHNYGTIENVITEGTELHQNTGGTISNGYANGLFSTLGRVGYMVDALDGENAIGGAGGIVGTNYKGATIKSCFNKMNIRAKVGGGGIASINYGLIENCFNYGCVGTTGDTASNMEEQFDFSYLGGMSGVNYGTINKCGNLNKVYAHRLPWLYSASNNTLSYRMNIGGITGDNIGTKENGEYVGGIITECFNYGRIHGDHRVGGIAGQSNGYISSCASYCFMGARYRLGGIVGYQKDDDYGVVTSCSAIYRIKSSQSTTVTDASGKEYEVSALSDGKISENTDTITEYYNLSKYADHCAYHSNCGNAAPIDTTSEVSTNVTTKGAELYKAYDALNNSGKWSISDAGSDEKYITSSMVALNKSYQVYLSSYLTWQKGTIKAIVNGKEYEFVGCKGINYLTSELISNGSVWAKENSNRNMSGYIPGTMPSSIEELKDKNVIWLTDINDENSVWDGFLRDDITIYAKEK